MEEKISKYKQENAHNESNKLFNCCKIFGTRHSNRVTDEGKNI